MRSNKPSSITVARNVASALGEASVAFLDMDAYYVDHAELSFEQRDRLTCRHQQVRRRQTSDASADDDNVHVNVAVDLCKRRKGGRVCPIRPGLEVQARVFRHTHLGEANG